MASSPNRATMPKESNKQPELFIFRDDYGSDDSELMKIFWIDRRLTLRKIDSHPFSCVFTSSC